MLFPGHLSARRAWFLGLLTAWPAWAVQPTPPVVRLVGDRATFVACYEETAEHWYRCGALLDRPQRAPVTAREIPFTVPARGRLVAVVDVESPDAPDAALRDCLAIETLQGGRWVPVAVPGDVLRHGPGDAPHALAERVSPLGAGWTVEGGRACRVRLTQAHTSLDSSLFLRRWLPTSVRAEIFWIPEGATAPTPASAPPAPPHPEPKPDTFAAACADPCAADGEFVRGAFRATFHREPQPRELGVYEALLRQGHAREDVVRMLFVAGGYLDRNSTAADFVRDAYQVVLGREPQPLEQDAGVAELAAGARRYAVLNRLLAGPYPAVRAACGGGAPRGRAPQGEAALVECRYIRGWAHDPDSRWPVIVVAEVETPDGPREVAASVADLPREGVDAAMRHTGFLLAVPPELRDGVARQVHVRILDNTAGKPAPARGSPFTVQCF